MQLFKFSSLIILIAYLRLSPAYPIECDYTIVGHLDPDNTKYLICLSISISIRSNKDGVQPIIFDNVFGTPSGVLEAGESMHDFIKIKEHKILFQHLVFGRGPLTFYFDVKGEFRNGCIYFDENDISPECRKN